MSISLRDQFAIQVLSGLLSNPGGPIQQCGMRGWGTTNCDFDDVIALSYQLADGMLTERDKQPGRLEKIRMAAQNMVNRPEGISIEKTGELILGLIDNYGSRV